MSLLSRLFGPKYNDEELSARAESALIADPLITNHASLGISCEDGVVTLNGHVSSEREKNQAEGAIRSSLRQAGLKFENIDNRIIVDQ